MNPRTLERVLGCIDRDQERMIGFLGELVRIPSVNPWFTDYRTDDSEQAVQEFLAETLREMGFSIDLWEVDPEKLRPYAGMPGYYEGRPMQARPNLCATLKGTGGGRSLLLTGHADVVTAGEGWTKPPFAALVENGRLYGRGAVDMKGGIAAMVMAADAIRRSGIRLQGDLLVGTVPDEEAGGMGTLDFVHRGVRADGAIMTEPTALEIAPMCRGILWGKIVIPARAGHIEMAQGDWRDGGAVDAVQLVRRYLDEIDRLNLIWASEKTHPLLPMPCQLLVAQVRAGEYPSAFAGSAEISFDAQYLPCELDDTFRGSRVKQEIENFVAAVADSDDWMHENPPHVEWLLDADCAETPVDGTFVRCLSAAADCVDAGAKVSGAGSHTDMGWYVRSGIPTVNFGPGDPKIAHQPDEFILLDEYIEGIRILAAMILHWCGVDD